MAPLPSRQPSHAGQCPWGARLVIWFVVLATACSAAIHLARQGPAQGPAPAFGEWDLVGPTLLACACAGLLLYWLHSRGRRAADAGGEWQHSTWGLEAVAEDR